jgi:hypothetical protein
VTPIDSLVWLDVPKPPYVHDGDRVPVSRTTVVSGVVEECPTE